MILFLGVKFVVKIIEQISEHPHYIGFKLRRDPPFVS
jgi:hypothetical protein